MNKTTTIPKSIIRFGNPLFPIIRWSSTPASDRLINRINAHLSSSKLMNPAKMPRAISKFITHYPWTLHHSPGSGVMSMHNDVDARRVDIKWEILNSSPGNFLKVRGISRNISPTSYQATIPFSISVEDKLTPQGMVFHCRTKRGTSYRYVINSVQCYASHSERDSITSYKGPLFESLEPALQEAFDEVLNSWGMTSEVIDFVEASSQYYNNSEYIRWLLNINDFISSS